MSQGFIKFIHGIIGFFVPFIIGLPLVVVFGIFFSPLIGLAGLGDAHSAVSFMLGVIIIAPFLILGFFSMIGLWALNNGSSDSDRKQRTNFFLIFYILGCLTTIAISYFFKGPFFPLFS